MPTPTHKKCQSHDHAGRWALLLFSCAGKLFHSGLPHKSINPMELLMDAVLEIQKRFYKDFPAHPLETK
jgi:hypothetical protein